MRLIAFPQWDKLTSLLRGMARRSAADYAQRKIVRIIPKNGIAHLANYAANLLAVEGGTTTIIGKKGRTLLYKLYCICFGYWLWDWVACMRYMAQGYIAQTLPKKTKSPLQRYRLLRKGKAVLA